MERYFFLDDADRELNRDATHSCPAPASPGCTKAPVTNRNHPVSSSRLPPGAREGKVAPWRGPPSAQALAVALRPSDPSPRPTQVRRPPMAAGASNTTANADWGKANFNDI
ncbi:hypothetical protein ACWD9X_43995, partial [Streptomyces sp. NPDC005075]